MTCVRVWCDLCESVVTRCVTCVRVCCDLVGFVVTSVSV